MIKKSASKFGHNIIFNDFQKAATINSVFFTSLNDMFTIENFYDDLFV